MTILQIVPRIPAPPIDGGAIYIYNIAKYLKKNGCHMVMAAFESNKHVQDPDLMSQTVQLYHTPGKFRPYHPLAVAKATLLRQPVSIYHRMNRKRMGKLLAKIEEIPDIILLEGIHSAHFLKEVREIFPNKPVVLRQSNVEYLLLKRNGDQTSNPLIRRFYYDQAKLMKRYEISAMQQVDALTAITEFDRQCFLADVPNVRSEVIPAGAEIPDKDGSIRDRNHIIALSNWLWKPNIDGLTWFFENVWEGLVNKHKDLQLTIAGHGLSESFLKKYRSDSVHFLGFVDDITELRSKATLQIVPLFSGSGMKLKIVEGLAAGLPMVTTQIGAEGIDISHDKEILIADTAKSFSAQVSRLLDHPELCDRISKEARKAAIENYSWQAQAAKLKSFLESLL